MDQFQRDNGAPAGRGSYEQSLQSSRLIEQTRSRAARLINAERSQNVVFTYNCTDGLSTVFFGLLKPGDHVVTSVVEHNSVLRPLKMLEKTGVEVTHVGCDKAGRFQFEEVANAVQSNTRLISLIHVSNVTGAIQPIEKIKSLCADHKVLFLLDAAQSLGHLPIDVKQLGCDILASSGHKGLLGPLGTGILYLSDSAAEQIIPLRAGGTGRLNSQDVQPDQLPDKYESGNMNVAGIVGLGEGMKFIESEAGTSLVSRSRELASVLVEGLKSIDGITLYGPESMEERMNVTSVSIDGFDCHEAAQVLDGNWSIQTRAGLHCAPLLHRALRTEASGGLLRLSTGLFTTREEIDATLNAFSKITSSQP